MARFLRNISHPKRSLLVPQVCRVEVLGSYSQLCNFSSKGYCVFVDAEHALDPALAETIGVNTENLLLSQPDCGEQALSLVDTLIRSGSVDTVGSQVLVKIVKNKLAPPFKNVEFELEFGKGISREGEIIDLATKHKFVIKAGSFYTYNDRKLHGKEAFKKFLAENESAREELAAKLREKLLETESKKERQSDISDGDTSEEIISNDISDEEGVTAIEA
ncbi:A. thaliana recA homolog 2 [Hibiscus trionum]|uniref:A. thaliana recA homolog 2 n=1 Tax=Hibiscus trionum TaxID=183268 RepID=A0A9W7JJA8_HIBTR|nr:A. thaliana recA homolog 2 [Hibiscus trionum]